MKVIDAPKEHDFLQRTSVTSSTGKRAETTLRGRAGARQQILEEK